MTALRGGLFHYTKRSFSIHLFLFSIIAVLGYLRETVFEQVKRENIMLVNSSVRVDVVGMPRMTIKELKAIDMTGGVKEEVVDEQKPMKSESKELEFIAKKKHKVDFKNLLKKYSKDKRIKSKKRPRKKKVSGKSLKELVIEGNRLSKGAALVGGSGEATAGELAEYMSQLPGKVRPNWNLPGYLSDKELQCRIRIFISAHGELG